MTEKEQLELVATLKNEVVEQFEKESKSFADKESVEGLRTAIASASSKEDLQAIKDQLDQVAVSVKAIKEDAKAPERKGLIDFIKENSETLKAIKENAREGRAHKGFTVKATQIASDIGSRDYLGEIEAGIEKKPVRTARISTLFPVDSVASEYLHYWEEDVVTRDAKFVVACATSTHNTKKTWVKRTIELAKIRDMVDVCVDMLEDYSFVESELRMLVNESIQLRKDFELLLGTGVASTDLLSINTVSSEFNPANVLAPFDGANGFQDANLEQLVHAMSAQIQIFGQEATWLPSHVVMNFADYVRYANLKDANGNKLIRTMSDEISTIAGLTVVTSPIVAPNTLYVMDASKGRIKQRKGYTATLSFENKDNIEHETATLVAYERLQFHVRNINRDAFMRCSDIATAITAITKP